MTTESEQKAQALASKTVLQVHLCVFMYSCAVGLAVPVIPYITESVCNLFPSSLSPSTSDCIHITIALSYPYKPSNFHNPLPHYSLSCIISPSPSGISATTRLLAHYNSIHIQLGADSITFGYLQTIFSMFQLVGSPLMGVIGMLLHMGDKAS